MRAAPQKESRLEMEEELEEVREVIRRREEWETGRESMDHTTPRHATRRRRAGKGLLRRRSLVRSIESQSNKAKTDVEMRSPKGRKEGRKEGRKDGRRRKTEDRRDPDSDRKEKVVRRPTATLVS